MGFLDRKATQVTLTLPLNAAETQKARPFIEIILSNLSVDQMELLSKAVTNPLVKMKAIDALKDHFNS